MPITLYVPAGTDSPVTSYVEQEMYFLSPHDDEEEEEEDNTTPYDYRFAIPPPSAFEMPPMKVKNGTSSILKLGTPTQYFTATSRIITSTPPGYCAPKWSQLQFTE